MGAEQSAAVTSGSKGSNNRTESVGGTFSAGKETVNNDPKSNNTLQNAKAQPADVTRKKAHIDDIIVVSEKVKDLDSSKLDIDVAALRALKPSRPIIPNVVGYVTEAEYMALPRINSNHFTEMVLRFQSHLSECAEAVAFDENAISKRMKEVDAQSAKVLKEMTERHKYMEGVINQIHKVTEVNALLVKIESNLSSTCERLKILNQMLPDEDQIDDPEFL